MPLQCRSIEDTLQIEKYEVYLHEISFIKYYHPNSSRVETHQYLPAFTNISGNIPIF